MDLSFTPEEEKFRAEVRAWLETAMPTYALAAIVYVSIPTSVQVTPSDE